jgi:sugar lactone lactonase YvrE
VVYPLTLKKLITKITLLNSVVLLTIICLLASCSKGNSGPAPVDNTKNPIITSINITEGVYNSEVKVLGSGFSKNLLDNKIFFNGKEAKQTFFSSTQIWALVPLSAGTGNISVSVNGINANGPGFTYIPADVVISVAGQSPFGKADGQGSAAGFNDPFDLTIDKDGNIFVADQRNNLIRKITPTGLVSTFAGSGRQGYANGMGILATFDGPRGITSDKAGNIYVTDQTSGLIRKITPQGLVSTLAGNPLSTSSYADGLGSSARFFKPTGLCVDSEGNLYIADTGNNRIRKITPAGLVSTLAGSGQEESTDGQGKLANITHPTGITIDKSGNLFVTEFYTCRIRKITPDGFVTRYAGRESGYKNGPISEANFQGPTGITIDIAGNIYVADTNNKLIRKISTDGIVSTSAGIIGSFIEELGILSKANFIFPTGVGVDAAGKIYVADVFSNQIKKITFQ